MKMLFALIFFILLLPAIGRCADEENLSMNRIRVVFSNCEVIVSMFDNPTSQDFLSLLPMQVSFKDFAGEEKIAHLPRRLEAAPSPGPSEAGGDFTYYRPWGNLAVFYKGFGSDSQLTALGRIESGKERLAGMAGDVTARIERIQ